MRMNEKFGNTKIHNARNVAEAYKLFKLHTVLCTVRTFLYLNVTILWIILSYCLEKYKFLICNKIYFNVSVEIYNKRDSIPGVREARTRLVPRVNDVKKVPINFCLKMFYRAGISVRRFPWKLLLVYENVIETEESTRLCEYIRNECNNSSNVRKSSTNGKSAFLQKEESSF